jgi:hypothetical protein
MHSVSWRLNGGRFGFADLEQGDGLAGGAGRLDQNPVVEMDTPGDVLEDRILCRLSVQVQGGPNGPLAPPISTSPTSSLGLVGRLLLRSIGWRAHGRLSGPPNGCLDIGQQLLPTGSPRR